MSSTTLAPQMLAEERNLACSAILGESQRPVKREREELGTPRPLKHHISASSGAECAFTRVELMIH